MRRAAANIDALELLAVLNEQQRWATSEEQKILAGYTSWGAAASIFDRRRPEWADLRDQLTNLVTPEVYRRLEETTLTAFFTSDEIITPMWDALKAAGYTTGTVLEPGSGTGNFIAHAPDTTAMVGVEVDPISAQIAQLLYPEAQVLNQGFETLTAADNTFTAAVGNVPFGQFQLYDPHHNSGSHSIHNHFIIKTLDLVQPGGYVALVTSTATADAQTSDARADMIARADLISAVRLPTRSFRDVAGTDVTADILIFRVREPGLDPSPASRRFLTTDELQLDNNEILRVNSFFVDNPDHVLGRPSMTTGQYGRPTITVTADPNIPLADAITMAITADIHSAVQQGHGLTAVSTGVAPAEIAAAAPQVPGTITYDVDDTGKITFKQLQTSTGSWEEIKPSRGARAEEWKALLDLRDTTLQLQAAYRTNTDVSRLQQQLHTQYDVYVETYGPLNRVVERPPRVPSKTTQQAIYRELVADWQAENLLDAAARPPAELDEEFRAQAATPITPDIKDQPHIGRLRHDPHIMALMSIELYDERTKTAEKARIFYGNPARPDLDITHADTLEDGIALSLDRFGVIDPAAVATFTGLETDIVETELTTTGAAYRDPDNPDVFIKAQHYLSGVVADKLDVARLKAAEDPRFRVNVKALEKVQPTPITEGIDIRPGVRWIDNRHYVDFLVEKFGLPRSSIDLTVTEDKWSLKLRGLDWEYGGDLDYAYGVIAANNKNHTRFNYQATSPEARQFPNQGLATVRNDGVAVTALQMFERVLNLESPPMNWSSAWTTEHPHSSGVNSEAAAFAQRRSRALRDAFSTWIMADDTRRREVIDAYNRTFNSYVAANWDGSYRSFPGLGTEFTPYSYQRNAVERINNEPAVLLNHCVGAGKTGTFLMGAAELKRLGLIHQPWIVVPNHIAEQVTLEANRWYPQARVLSAAGISTPEERRTFVAQTTSQDWDFVIVPQSVFSKIPMTPETQLNYLQKRRDELYNELLAAQAVDDESITVKVIQRALKSQDTRIQKLLSTNRDVGMEFEATPCDYLIIDEAHTYKNLQRTSTIDDISHVGSQRASDLDMKLDYLRSKAVEAGKDLEHTPIVTFATGTPLANNLAEIWVMAHYLRPDLLERTHTATINAWAAAFTEQSEDVEVRPTGTGLRTVNRTRQFLNVGDLAAMCEPFMDLVTSDQIEARLPELRGGENQVVEFDVDNQTKDFMADFDARAKKDWSITHPDAAPAIDGPLKILSDGRKVALDPRLVNLDYHGYSPRVQAATDRIIDVWTHARDNRYRDSRGTVSPQPGGLQIVFLDESTPKKDGSYNVYDQLKKSLVEHGMNPNRIAYIHDWDHDKVTLFERCRTGEIDVLVGSTAKLGTGANIQDRAVALHHLDVPWKPADLEQREGRILRQGNQNDEVQIFNYVAKGTADAISWQVLYRKTRFITQFLQADRSMRSMEALESSAEDAAAQNKAIATGDSRYVDLLNLNKEVAELESQRQEWAAAVHSGRMARIHETQTISNTQAFLDDIEPLRQAAQQWIDTEDKTWVMPDERVLDDRAEVAQAVGVSIVNAFRNRQEDIRPLVTIGGLSFSVGFNRAHTRVEVTPVGFRHAPRDMTIGFEFADLDGLDVTEATATKQQYTALQRIENRVRSVPKEVAQATATRDAAQHRLRQLDLTASPVFPHEERLSEVTVKRDALEAKLKAVDSSVQARQLRQERAERLQTHGRKAGWSLRLSPTTAYAQVVEKTTVEDTIRRAKRDELDALHSSGAITFETYAARRHALDSPALQNSLSAKALAGRALIDATTVTQPSDTAPAASTPTVVDSDAEQQQLWEPPAPENDRTL